MILQSSNIREVCIQEWGVLFCEEERNLPDEVSIPEKDWNWLRDQVLNVE